MTLTLKQEKFCYELIRTGNKTLAYRYAYNVKNMANNSVYTEANRLSQSPKIIARVEELKKEWFKGACPSIKLREPVTFEDLWEGALLYFQWCDENPERKLRKVRLNDQYIDQSVSVERKYNLDDLCAFLQLPDKFFQTLKVKSYGDFVDVAIRIEAIIQNQYNQQEVKTLIAEGTTKYNTEKQLS